MNGEGAFAGACVAGFFFAVIGFTCLTAYA